MNCYACAVYGVILPKDDLVVKQLEAAVAVMMEDGDSDLFIGEMKDEAILNLDEQLVDALRTHWGAPPGATLQYGGDEDEIISAGSLVNCWFLGFGILDFPYNVPPFRDIADALEERTRWYKEASWHTWVLGY